jgi:NAD(P)-dependent dehydrogenase (short-subunit alcohol dehydrogenase family)
METKGHAAIVTGGASGLGAATARALAAAGAKVAVIDVNEKAATEMAADVKGIAVGCDVADSASAEAAVKKAAAAHGPARILVNCAGIGPAKRIVGREGPTPLADYERVIRINLIGTFNMMRLVAAAMQAAEPLSGGERGVIVSTASVAAFDGQIGQAAYASSKGGVVALTLPAAREFAQFGIRVLAIAPGIFGTPMLRALPQEAQDSLGAASSVSQTTRRTARVRRPRPALHSQCLPQRRSDPTRRRAAHGTALKGITVASFSSTRTVRIEWGDCDPAGIIFYRAISKSSMHRRRFCSSARLHDQIKHVQAPRFRRLSARAYTRAIHEAHSFRG